MVDKLQSRHNSERAELERQVDDHKKRLVNVFEKGKTDLCEISAALKADKTARGSHQHLQDQKFDASFAWAKTIKKDINTRRAALHT
jgi:hypothetical protein